MTTKQEAAGRSAQPRTPPAANDDFSATRTLNAGNQEKAQLMREAGWDPYEVWRTRIKPRQDVS
jgi:hypothetical protein